MSRHCGQNRGSGVETHMQSTMEAKEMSKEKRKTGVAVVEVVP